MEALSRYRLLLLLPETDANQVEERISGAGDCAWIPCRNPRLAYARVMQRFFMPKRAPGVDGTAQVSQQARLGEGVVVGRNSVIDAGAVIGRDTVIEDQVTVRGGVTVGSHCWIKSGAVIGEQGFGFDFEEDGTPVRIPHVGETCIGDHVEVGSNTVICCGTIAETRIDDHVMINDLVHIAHNCQVGRNCIIAGGKLSGSVTLGRDVWIAPGSIIRNKVFVGDGALIGAGSVVVGDIDPGVVVYGNPARVNSSRESG